VTRSENMRRIRSKNTQPELLVRKLLWQMGYRYRLHRKDLPGKPDIVFSGRRKIIFVHGCFWHGHDCKEGSRRPKSNLEYWLPKIKRNQERDAEVQERLNAEKWKCMMIWECELKNIPALMERLAMFLEAKSMAFDSSMLAQR